MCPTVFGIEARLALCSRNARAVAHEAGVHGSCGHDLGLAALSAFFVEVLGNRCELHLIILPHALDGVVLRVAEDPAGAVRRLQHHQRFLDPSLDLAGTFGCAGSFEFG